MADSSKTVEIIFQGVDKVSKTVKGIEKTMSGIGNAAKPIANIADSVLKLDAALAALAVGGLALAYKKAIDFEDTLVGLNKVLSENENIDTAKKKVAELSETYGESQASLIESTTNFKQAGYDLTESLTLVESALKLKIAGDVDAATATETLIRIQKGYRLEAESSLPIVELLNFASNNYATNSEKLAEALARSAGQAKQAGLNFRESAQFLVPIIEVFQDGQMAGTAFGTSLLRLKDDTARINEAFKILGFTTEENANRPFEKTADILKHVAKNWNNVDDVQKDYVANLLFGKEHAGKMIVAMEGMAKAQSLVAASSEEMGKVLDKEVETRLKSSSIQVDKLKNSFDNLLIAMGEKYKKGVNSVIDGTTNIENVIKKAVESGAFDKLFKAFDKFNENIAKKLQKTADILPDVFAKLDFSGIIKAFEDLGGEIGDAFQSVFAGIDLSTTEGMTRAVQLVIDSFELLINTTSGIIDAWEPFIEAVSNIIQYFSNLDEATQKTLGIFGGIAQQATIVGAAVAGISVSVSGLGSAITGGAAAFTGFVALIGGPVGLVVAISAASVALVTFSEDFRKMVANIPILSDVIQGAAWALDKIINFSGKKPEEEIKRMESAFELAKLQAVLNLEKLRDIDQQKVEPEVNNADMLKLLDNMESYVEERQKLVDQGIITTKIDADTRTAEEKIADFWKKIDEEDAKKIKLDADTKPAEKTIRDFKKEYELEQFEIEADLDKTKIEEDTKRLEIEAEKVQKSFEYKADVDIAKAEAAADVLESTFDSIGNTISTTSESITSLIDQLSDADYSARQEIKDQIDRKEKMEDEAFEQQKELMQAQVEYYESMRKLADVGEIAITVEGANELEPALEMMWDVMFKYTQAKLNTIGFTGLLGAPA